MKLFLLALLIAGCELPPAPPVTAPAPPAPVFFKAVDVVTLDLTGAPQWLVEGTQKAIQFWDAHGLSFEIAHNGQIPISAHELPLEIELGMYTFDGKIYIPQKADESVVDCDIAHELGHSVAMMHASKGGGMMSIYASIWADGRCMWNDADQAELLRVLAL